MALLSGMSCIINQRRLLLMASRNFHTCRVDEGGEAELTLTIKNKWPAGWMKVWFYCKVPVHVFHRGGKFVHALCSHMSPLNFHTKPSIQNSGEDLSDDAFVWTSRNIRGQDAVEDFVSCSVWPLAGGISFEHVKVGLTPVSKLKLPLPRFPFSREDEDDDARFLARVEQEARNVVGSSMHVEHEACIGGLPNNGRLNRALELMEVAYGPCSTLVFVEVLKKRKAEASGKVLVKRPKVLEMRGTEPTKVSGARAKGGLKRPSGVDIMAGKFVKLSKGVVPRAIALAAASRITPEACESLDSFGASNFKTGGKDRSSKTMPGVKKVTPSATKHIILVIRALSMISSKGTQESSSCD
jgi:hypothetical protein